MSRWRLRARKLLHRVSLVILVRVVIAVAHIVPYRLAVKAGGLLGQSAFLFLRRDRNRALEHLRTAFPGEDTAWIKRTARSTFVHLGKSLVEVVLMNPGRAEKVVTFQGLENLRAALSLGKGVIYVTGHLGNWELMAGSVSQVVPVTGIGAPIEPETLNTIIVGLRGKMGATMIVRGRSGAAKELIRVFRENRVLGILMDQDTEVEGAFVEFMGRPAWTPTAAAQMAIKFDAPVVFGYATREKDDRHTITIEGPLRLFRSGDREEDIRKNTSFFTKKLEEAIKRQPSQWVWMHRRWRRQP